MATPPAARKATGLKIANKPVEVGATHVHVPTDECQLIQIGRVSIDLICLISKQNRTDAGAPGIQTCLVAAISRLRPLDRRRASLDRLRAAGRREVWRQHRVR